MDYCNSIRVFTKYIETLLITKPALACPRADSWLSKLSEPLNGTSGALGWFAALQQQLATPLLSKLKLQRSLPAAFCSARPSLGEEKGSVFRLGLYSAFQLILSFCLLAHVCPDRHMPCLCNSNSQEFF